MASDLPRLQSELWVDAELRRALGCGLMGYRLHKGDIERGSVIVKVTDVAGGAYFLQQTMDFDGNRVWARTPSTETISEQDIDQKIMKYRMNDPDLWVIEIEDPNGIYDFPEPITTDL